MNERIKELRLKMGLSQEEFGDKLGITKQSISRIEKAQVKITESNILAICREFSVRREWLETGEGEMFQPTPMDLVDKLVAEYDLGPVGRRFLEILVKLDEEDLEKVYRFMQAIVLDPDDESAGPPPLPSDLQLAADLVADRARREFLREKEAGADSRASPSTA